MPNGHSKKETQQVREVEIEVENGRGTGCFSLVVYDKPGIARMNLFAVNDIRIARNDAPESFALLEQLVTTLLKEKGGLEAKELKKRKKYSKMEEKRKRKHSGINYDEGTEAPAL